jgi:DNA repair protein RadD
MIEYLGFMFYPSIGLKLSFSKISFTLTKRKRFFTILLNLSITAKMTIILRNDQQILKNDVNGAWNQGAQNVLAVLSTGGGKSVIVSDIVLDGARLNWQQAVIAHRNELVSQMSAHVARRGIPHRIIGSNATVAQITRQHRVMFGRSFVNPSARTAVVGVDTLIAREDDLKVWAEQTDQWVIDEGHHVLKENKWGRAVKMFPRARGLGVTATPLRADGKGLGRQFEGVFDVMRVGLEMRELIRIGALSDFEIVCPASDLEINEQEVSAGGDWSNKKLRAAAKKSHIVGDVVQAYCKYAYGRKAICFSTDVETAGEQAQQFNAAGISAAALSANTPFNVREKYIEEFRTGKIWVLINVDLFDEGFDVPACDVVIMSRPTASLGKYRQMTGRALRPIPGKIALIIDHVSNVVRHGLPDKFIPWTLARRDKRGAQMRDPDEILLTVCKHCTKPYERFMTICPYCGMEPPLPEMRDRSIQVVDGDLILLDRAMLEEMRRATEIETPADIAARVGSVAGDFAGRGVMNKQIEKIAAQDRLKHTIAQWAAIERANGRKDREIHKKFFLTAGVDVLSALDGSRSRQDYETLTQTIEGWYST